MKLEDQYKNIIEEYTKVLKENPKWRASVTIGVGALDSYYYLTIATNEMNEGGFEVIDIKREKINEGAEVAEQLADLINLKR